MNILLTHIIADTVAAQTRVQGISLLMVLAVVVFFIISWVFNRISILRIRKNSESIQDLSTVMQHTLNVSNNYVVRLSMQDHIGFNLHGDFLPDEGMTYEESLEYIHPDDRRDYTAFLKRLMDGDKMSECTFRWDISREKQIQEQEPEDLCHLLLYADG